MEILNKINGMKISRRNIFAGAMIIFANVTIHELSLSMPNTGWWNRGKLKPLRTLKQWNKWQKTLGGEAVKIGCDVIEELKNSSAPDLQAHMNAYQCVASCSE